MHTQQTTPPVFAKTSVVARHSRFWIALNSLLAVSCLTAAGYELPNNIQTTIQTLRSTSLESVRHIRITSGTNELLLVAPQGLRIDATMPGRITLAPHNLGYTLFVRLITASPESATAGSVELNSSYVLAQFPGATITEQSTASVTDKLGKAYSFVWPVAGASDRIGRTTLIQTSAGTLDITLISDPKEGKSAEDDFRSIMLSLRTNENGAIKMPPIPANS